MYLWLLAAGGVRNGFVMRWQIVSLKQRLLDTKHQLDTAASALEEGRVREHQHAQSSEPAQVSRLMCAVPATRPDGPHTPNDLARIAVRRRSRPIARPEHRPEKAGSRVAGTSHICLTR